jgi:hypothetical protein
MEWTNLWKKAAGALIAVLMIGSPLFSPIANSSETFSFFPQGPISPQSEMAVRHDMPGVAMDSLGNTYAVWLDYRRGNPDIYFAFRPPGGPWQGNVRINDDTGTASQLRPDIAVDANGNAYAVWQDFRNGTSDIYFSYRPFGGSWQANTKVNHDTSNTIRSQPAIAVDANGNAYAVWTEYRNGNPNIYFSYRPAGGGWQGEGKVNQASGTAKQYVPRIASDPNGNVMVVWQDGRSGNEDIYSAYRPFGGSWSAEVLVNNDGGSSDQLNPDVVFLTVDGYPTFIAVWEDRRNGVEDIYYAINSFGNWDFYQGKVNDGTSTNMYGPRVAADQAGNAYVVWEDRRDGASDIYFSYRTPGIIGSWTPNKKINDDGQFQVSQSWPGIAVNPASGNAFAVWQDNRRVSHDIFASFRPSGGNWGENLKINDDNAGQSLQYSPVVALDASGNAFAWWGTDHLHQGDVFFASRPRGGTWQSPVRVNDALGQVVAPPQDRFAGAIDSQGNAFAAWVDVRNGKQDIYCSFRTFEGSWQANERVSPDDYTVLYSAPGVLLDKDGNAYVTWAGSWGGKKDVYFARRPAGGAWQAPEIITDAPAIGYAAYPSLAMGPTGTVYALWADGRNGNSDIFFSYRPPRGNWHSNEKVNNDPGSSEQIYPKIAVDGQGNAYAIWEDHRSGNPFIYDIYFSYRPYGEGWQANMIVNQDISGWQREPDLAVNPQGEAYAVWWGTSNDLYFSYRPSGGAWSAGMKVNSHPGYVSSSSSIAVNSSGTVLAAWQDTRWGESAVFYALANEINCIYLPLIVKP